MQSSTRSAYAIVICVVNVLAILGNMIGIRLLSRILKGSSNQMKIIASISAVDIALSSLTISITVLDLIGRKLPGDNESIYLWCIRTSFYAVWYCMFYVLTLERFVGGHFPFVYRRFSATKKFRNVLIGCWTLPMFIAPPLCATDPQLLRIIIDKYVWITLDSVFIVFFMYTYISIFYRKHRSGARLGRTPRHAENQRFFGVTTAMLITFLLLETAPSVTSSMLFSANVEVREVYQLLFEFFWSLNLLADPLIYIFLQPRIWKRHINCCCCTRNRIQNTDVQNPTTTFALCTTFQENMAKTSCTSCIILQEETKKVGPLPVLANHLERAKDRNSDDGQGQENLQPDCKRFSREQLE